MLSFVPFSIRFGKRDFDVSFIYILYKKESRVYISRLYKLFGITFDKMIWTIDFLFFFKYIFRKSYLKGNNRFPNEI